MTSRCVLSVMVQMTSHDFFQNRPTVDTGPESERCRFMRTSRRVISTLNESAIISPS